MPPFKKWKTNIIKLKKDVKWLGVPFPPDGNIYENNILLNNLSPEGMPT